MTTTLMHISDLHFGLRRATRLTDAMLRAEDDIRPSAVLCSGDLVEWSETNGPWRELKAFLERLKAPRLVIPGNHDIVRWNPFERLWAPLGRYHKFVSRDRDTVVTVDGAVLVGLGTPRRWTFDLGHVSEAQLAYARQAFQAAPPGLLRVVAVHHGPQPLRRGLFRDHVWGGRRLTRALIDMGADLVVSGHSHFPHVAELGQHARGATVWSQAGTTSCHRVGGKGNSLSVVRSTPGQLSVEWWFYDEAVGRFRCDSEPLRFISRTAA